MSSRSFLNISFSFQEETISNSAVGVLTTPRAKSQKPLLIARSKIHRGAARVVANGETHVYRIGTNLCTYVFALDGEAVGEVGAVADEVEGHAQAVERPAEGEVLLGRVAQHVHQQFLALLQFLCLPFPNLRLPC